MSDVSTSTCDYSDDDAVQPSPQARFGQTTGPLQGFAALQKRAVNAFLLEEHFGLPRGLLIGLSSCSSHAVYHARKLAASTERAAIFRRSLRGQVLRDCVTLPAQKGASAAGESGRQQVPGTAAHDAPVSRLVVTPSHVPGPGAQHCCNTSSREQEACGALELSPAMGLDDSGSTSSYGTLAQAHTQPQASAPVSGKGKAPVSLDELQSWTPGEPQPQGNPHPRLQLLQSMRRDEPQQPQPGGPSPELAPPCGPRLAASGPQPHTREADTRKQATAPLQTHDGANADRAPASAAALSAAQQPLPPAERVLCQHQHPSWRPLRQQQAPTKLCQRQPPPQQQHHLGILAPQQQLQPPQGGLSGRGPPAAAAAPQRGGRCQTPQGHPPHGPSPGGHPPHPYPHTWPPQPAPQPPHIAGGVPPMTGHGHPLPAAGAWWPQDRPPPPPQQQAWQQAQQLLPLPPPPMSAAALVALQQHQQQQQPLLQLPAATVRPHGQRHGCHGSGEGAPFAHAAVASAAPRGPNLAPHVPTCPGTTSLALALLLPLPQPCAHLPPQNAFLGHDGSLPPEQLQGLQGWQHGLPPPQQQQLLPQMHRPSHARPQHASPLPPPVRQGPHHAQPPHSPQRLPPPPQQQPPQQQHPRPPHPQHPLPQEEQQQQPQEAPQPNEYKFHIAPFLSLRMVTQAGPRPDLGPEAAPLGPGAQPTPQLTHHAVIQQQRQQKQGRHQAVPPGFVVAAGTEQGLQLQGQQLASEGGAAAPLQMQALPQGQAQALELAQPTAQTQPQSQARLQAPPHVQRPALRPDAVAGPAAPPAGPALAPQQWQQEFRHTGSSPGRVYLPASRVSPGAAAGPGTGSAPDSPEAAQRQLTPPGTQPPKVREEAASGGRGLAPPPDACPAALRDVCGDELWEDLLRASRDYDAAVAAPPPPAAASPGECFKWRSRLLEPLAAAAWHLPCTDIIVVLLTARREVAAAGALFGGPEPAAEAVPGASAPAGAATAGSSGNRLNRLPGRVVLLVRALVATALQNHLAAALAESQAAAAASAASAAVSTAAESADGASGGAAAVAATAAKAATNRVLACTANAAWLTGALMVHCGLPQPALPACITLSRLVAAVQEAVSARRPAKRTVAAPCPAACPISPSPSSASSSPAASAASAASASASAASSACSPAARSTTSLPSPTSSPTSASPSAASDSANAVGGTPSAASGAAFTPAWARPPCTSPLDTPIAAPAASAAPAAPAASASASPAAPATPLRCAAGKSPPRDGLPHVDSDLDPHHGLDLDLGRLLAVALRLQPELAADRPPAGKESGAESHLRSLREYDRIVAAARALVAGTDGANGGGCGAASAAAPAALTGCAVPAAAFPLPAVAAAAPAAPSTGSARDVANGSVAPCPPPPRPAAQCLVPSSTLRSGNKVSAESDPAPYQPEQQATGALGLGTGSGGSGDSGRSATSLPKEKSGHDGPVPVTWASGQARPAAAAAVVVSTCASTAVTRGKVQTQAATAAEPHQDLHVAPPGTPRAGPGRPPPPASAAAGAAAAPGPTMTSSPAAPRQGQRHTTGSPQAPGGGVSGGSGRCHR